MNPNSTITALLKDWSDGDSGALEVLTPLIYEDLHSIARRRMRTERVDHTLQVTGLVNEAFSRLADAELTYRNRAHFFAIAARTMRRILTDYGRRRGSQKRGGDMLEVTLVEDQISGGSITSIIELEDALQKLAKLDERKSDVLTLHFFGGMTYEEIAEALDVSAATIDRDLRFAKAWLANELIDD